MIRRVFELEFVSRSGDHPESGVMAGPPVGPCLGPEELAASLGNQGFSALAQRVDAHVASCSRCRRLLSGLMSRASEQGASTGEGAADELAIDDRVGRYQVLARIGAGGMGVVYAAHDPELDRKVALKLLRTDSIGASDHAPVRDRLLREARAMAQLAHPNVVAVHDVGSFEGQIFIAMELVAGQTLARWLAARSRTPREIVGRFLQAGSGLAAAHAAGVVHRDFKPSNVLVGDDGRVRVTDFGLARLFNRSEPGSAIAIGPAHPSEPGTDRSITLLEGTPYYMAPEQHLRAATDARTDQFGFCVALHVALAGGHPFEAQTADDLPAAVTSGRLRPLARSKRVDRRVRRVLLRGLSVRPEERYPTMDALLADLGRDPSRRVRRILAAASALALAAVAVAYAARQASPSCRGAERRLAGVWDGDRAAGVERAFRASGVSFAAASEGDVSRVLDGYARSWAAMHTEACEATRVRGEQSENLLELRMLCLDDSLRAMRGLTQALSRADAALVERAPRSVRALADLSACQDARALLGPAPPPLRAHARRRVAELRGELADVRALREAGAAGEGLARAGELARAAAQVAYRPLEAEILFELGRIEHESGDAAAGARTLERAVWAAEAGRHDRIAARAWTRLMSVIGHDQGRPAEALALQPRVTAIIERMTGDDELEGMLHLTTSALLREMDRTAEAEKEARHAVAYLERRLGPDDPRVGDALEHLGVTLGLENKHGEARATLERSLATLERVLGPEHPDVGKVASSLATICEAQGDVARAQSLRRRVGQSAAGPLR